jgi:hypothetical protein
MKKILFGLLILAIGSQLLTSCNSSSSVLNQFSKRKYLKSFKATKTKKDDTNSLYVNQQKEANNHISATKEIDPEYIVLNYAINYDNYEIQKTDSKNDKYNLNFNKNMDWKSNVNSSNIDFEVSKLKINSPDTIYHIYPREVETPKVRVVPLMTKISFLCMFPGIFLGVPFVISPIFAIIGIIQSLAYPKHYKGAGWGILAFSLWMLTITVIVYSMASVWG